MIETTLGSLVSENCSFNPHIMFITKSSIMNNGFQIYLNGYLNVKTFLDLKD